MELGLRDRVCAVTGGSLGIGAATARLLCAEGARVLLIGRNGERLEAAAANAREAGGSAEPLVLDVTAPDAGGKLVGACSDCYGAPISCLVNNAGTSWTASPDELTDDDWQRQWNLNVMGPMRLMRAVAPAMAAVGWGRIVNVSSSSGKRPSQNNIAYSVTKAAQLSLSRAFADEWASKGVLVNAVAPGLVLTGLWTEPGGLADQIAERTGSTREEVLADRARSVPLGRSAEPEEIAAVITFLCSERASDVVGAAWSVDGGTVPVII